MQPSTAPKRKFRELSKQEKLKFVGKLMIFFVSFGFAFPLLLSGD